METSGGIRASLAGRYASALFDLARDERQIDAVGRSLDALSQALVDSKDFAELVASPLVSRDEAGKAFAALARAARASIRSPPISSACSPATAARASSRNVIRAFRPPRRRASRRDHRRGHHRRPLNDDQVAALKAQLRTRAGRDVAIDASVDPAILGGIVVKLGSQRSTPRSAPNSTVSHPAMKG